MNKEVFKFNFVSIMCAGEYISAEKIDLVLCNFCFELFKLGQLHVHIKKDTDSLPRENIDQAHRSASEPERRTQQRAAETEALNEFVTFLAVVDMPVGQRHVAPAVGVSQARHPLPGEGG